MDKRRKITVVTAAALALVACGGEKGPERVAGVEHRPSFSVEGGGSGFELAGGTVVDGGELCLASSEPTTTEWKTTFITVTTFYPDGSQQAQVHTLHRYEKQFATLAAPSCIFLNGGRVNVLAISDIEAVPHGHVEGDFTLQSEFFTAPPGVTLQMEATPSSGSCQFSHWDVTRQDNSGFPSTVNPLDHPSTSTNIKYRAWFSCGGGGGGGGDGGGGGGDDPPCVICDE
ncbi:MAG: hypothetical protein ACREON_12655 [Gemmatimonadaceae bacterium]